MPHELFERAKVHMDRNEFDAAGECLLNYLNDDFWNPEAAMMLGVCMMIKGKHGMAAILAKRAVEQRPIFPEAWRNLGAAFKAEHKNPEAEMCWHKALEQEDLPAERAKLYASLGTLHINEGTPEKSLAYFDEGMKLDPENVDLQYNRSLALLELGRWKEGWRGYDLRFACGIQRSRHYGNLPVWDGAPGKRVIVWGEQGIGDEILFASCIPDMAKVCSKVILDCHPRLVTLFERSFPDVEIHGTRKLQTHGREWIGEADADAHISISSLTTHFRKRDEDFPGTPFLKAADPGLKRDRPRIGISWKGGTRRTRLDLRTIPLPMWMPIFEAVPQAEFYSLQYSPESAREVCELEETTGVKLRHYPGWVECKDYDRTASFVSTLDLVITVPTAVYHLAGGLGVPTWTLVPTRPAWTFAEKGELWYRDAVRFFRQPNENWAALIDTVAATLKAEAPAIFGHKLYWNDTMRMIRSAAQ